MAAPRGILTPRRALTDNLAALDVVVAHRGEDPASLTFDEQAALGHWHGWGAAPQVFDRPEFEPERARLQGLLGEDGYSAAARNTLNAHYTDPELVRAIWATMGDLGISSGVFVEPGCGSGHFLGAAPEQMVGLGIELDPATARIAELLHPRHDVRNADFARLPVVRGMADAVVGNVPFANVGLFDPEYNPARALSMHDHFVAKAAAMLAPGGVAIVITSRFTLDKVSTDGREAIGRYADFVGAVRLPSTAHQHEAGTSVVTDILVLRGRAPGEQAVHAEGFLAPVIELGQWRGTRLAEPMKVSAYLAARPDQVLGEVQVVSGPFGVQMRVAGRATGDEVAAALRQATTALPVARTRPAPASGPEDLLAPAAERRVLGRIERTPSGLFRRREIDGWVSHDPGAQRGELAALLGLREQVRALIALEGTPEAPDEVVEARRTDLATTYHRYVSNYGPVNRVTITEATDRRSYPRMGGFRKDPDFPRVAALEIYDEATGHARPATLLERRVLHPVVPPEHVDDPADALSMSLAQLGRLDEDFLAKVTGRAASDVLADLGDRVYVDPGLGRFVVAEEYLSGQVRAKLAVAREAVADDPALARNVAALEAVLPRDVTTGDLEGTLGAPWVPPALVEQFARALCPVEEARDEITVARADSTGEWVVGASGRARDAMSRGHDFGGAKFSAITVLGAALNGRSPTVYTAAPDDKRIIDSIATAAAVEKAEMLGGAFDRWLLREDSERSRSVLARYNEQFNGTVPRSYAGVRVAPPGLRSDFILRDHQHQAIARMIYGGDALLAHAVGAGKTAEMIVGAMERKRLGMCNRPCFVVPNHMLAQFSRDVVTLYPGAEVLVIDRDDISPAKRALFAARVTSHDWDAVVITHASFGRWGISAAATERVLTDRVHELRAELSTMDPDAHGADATLTKKIETSLLAQTERLKAAQYLVAARQDDHEFAFDQSGIDYLCVDEAHEFKNAALVTKARNLRGVPAGPGSQRANDLDEKLRCLREQYPGQAVLTMATGTPVTNTVAEVWVLAKYLYPDQLAALGLSSFDAFRAQFTQTTSDLELDTSGTRIRRIERLARYKNLPELARMLGEWADIVMDEDLDLPRPALAGGKRQVDVITPAPAMEEFMTVEVARRADAIHLGQVEPEEDNMLRLCSDCRLAAFDWESFRGERVDERHSPLAVAADRVARIYARNAERVYLSEGGMTHPRPGAFQLVFSDLGTPRSDEFSAYDRLRWMLVDRGVPAEKIGVIHEHDGDEKKARFFANCRNGHYAVALSSTAKMGVGTNVQDRLVALHHLSVPWRPTDIEQREGRILRQGNQNPEVEVYAYVVARSFASYGWQTLERKAGFIGQLLRADLNGPRVLEVTDSEALAYGEIKAIATDDETFLEVARLEDTIGRLERLQRSHGQEQASLGRREQSVGEDIVRSERRRDALAAPSAAVTAHQQSPWRIAIDGRVFDNQGDAARTLGPALTRYPRRGLLVVPGAEVSVDWVPDTAGAGHFRLDLGEHSITVSVSRRDHEGLIGALRRVTNQVAELPRRHEQAEAAVASFTEELARVRAKLGVPFPHEGELREARQSLATLTTVLEARYRPPDRGREGRADVTEGPSTTPAGAPGAHPTAGTEPTTVDRVGALLGAATGQAPGGAPTRSGPGSTHVSAAEAATAATWHSPSPATGRALGR